MFSLGFLFLLYSAAEGAASPISCYNDHGDSVDWIYLYKLPHHRHQQDEGLKYLLMDGGSEGWTEGKGLVNDSTGALGRTVGQLYEQNVWGGEIAYILYNDQKPDHEKGTDEDRNRGGHTKGVVLVGKTQGFWLVHSTPHFPPVKEGGEFSYPHSGIKNGQNFLCVTYPLGMFQTIGEQLQINEPFVYDCNVPDSMASVLPSLAEVCRRAKAEGKHVSLSHSAHFSPPPFNRSISLLSLAGTKFVSFAKSASFGNDLYHSWVAPTLQSDLLVQFWHLSKGILPSDCSLNWKVLNIKTISLGQSTTFNSTLDHSKWAASTGSGGQNEAGAWICVGDINRNKAEEKRGGGTVCQCNPTVWKAYRNAVKESYPCAHVVTALKLQDVCCRDVAKGGEIAYILYNDQKPDHEKGTDEDRNRGGHTKGVVLVGKTQGFWLVHSTPHFPPVKEGGEFSYPHSGIKNGQNFLCVTYPLGMFQTIGEQLQINEPFVYDCNVPDSMASVLPSLAEVCRRAKAEGKHVSLSHSAHFSPPPFNRSISLLSLAGTKFVSFAKSASFGNDLYHSWVAPTLQSDLLVQFWHLSKGILPSDCSLNWKVLNIKTISLGQSTTFNSTLDHSKWAASTGSGGQNEAGAWICVGDINRNKAEEKRGGGTVCQCNPTVWKAYRNAVKESYPCK